jgi:hypothetical protein
VARRVQRRVGFLLLAAAASCWAADPNAAAILRQAAEAVEKNRREAAFYIYQERIRELEIQWDGEVVEGGELGYEVIFVEGETYHKRVSVNGKPLTGRAAQEEDLRLRKVTEFRRNTPLEERRRRFIAAERTRLRFDVRTIAENHMARFDREETCPAGPCFVISVWPKPGTRRPRHASEWSLSLRGHLWIDAETSHPVRAEMEQAYDAFTQPEGSKSRFKWERVEGVWLIESIVSRVEVGSRRVAVRESLQEYSNYQRFQAESVLVFPDFP